MNYLRASTVTGLLAVGMFSQAAMAQTGGSGMSATSVPAADKKFAMMAAENDLAELQISNMALQKSNNDQVKQLAQKLIDDHTKTTNSMKEIAGKKGLTLPTQPDAKHQALATKLQSESGEKFDKDYIAANSMDHHKVVKAFEKEASDGQDPDIKSFASQFLPAIQEHTRMIDSDKGQMSGSK
jgi:putative membrane protein